MKDAFPYIYRWDRGGRKGRICKLTARSGLSLPGAGPALAFGTPEAKRFNTVRIEFADGHVTTTSGNAIRRRKAGE